MPYRTFFRLCVALAMVGLGLTAVEARIVTRTVKYRQDGTVMRGFLAYDDGGKGKRPGGAGGARVVGPERFRPGTGPKTCGSGVRGPGRGYVRRRHHHPRPGKAGKLAGALLKNPDLLRARAQAALQVLAADPRVDPRRLAAIGFCFGGSTVLELAYSGADLAGVVSFHGGRPGPNPGGLRASRPKSWCCTGPMTPMSRPLTSPR